MTKKELEERVKILEEGNDKLCNLIESMKEALLGQYIAEYAGKVLMKYVQEVTENEK